MGTKSSDWHRISGIDKTIRSPQNASCSKCGPIITSYDKTNNDHRCVRRTKIIFDPDNYHRVVPNQNSPQIVGKATDGVCSVCGPTNLWFLNGSYQCSTRDTKYIEILNKPIKITNNKVRWIEKAYNLKFDKYVEMFINQNEKCILCEKEITLSVGGDSAAYVDHDRKCCNFNAKYDKPVCGKCNRGLLCNNCNRGIGLLKDNLITLKNAIQYLEKHNT